MTEYDEFARRLEREAKCFAWKRDLLHHRVCELSDACFNAFTDRDGMFWGAPDEVAELIHRARRCHEIDELEYCEGHCEAAEAAILRARIAPERRHRKGAVPAPGRLQ